MKALEPEYLTKQDNTLVSSKQHGACSIKKRYTHRGIRHNITPLYRLLLSYCSAASDRLHISFTSRCLRSAFPEQILTPQQCCLRCDAAQHDMSDSRYYYLFTSSRDNSSVTNNDNTTLEEERTECPASSFYHQVR
jgi:hypothetical protein